MKNDIQEILLAYIDEPPKAMRTEIDRDEIFELAADIQKNGLINPITVRPVGKRYEIVAGHRRFLAHRFGGMLKIKCIVRDLNDEEAFGVMTSENLARTDVNPVDEATHTTRLVELHAGNIEKVAEIVNRSKEWVMTRLEIGQMPDDLKEALRADKIKIGVALALSQITDEMDRRGTLQMAISQGATLVVAQYWVAQWKAGLFGHATEHTITDLDAPNFVRKVVMLRCAVDGKEHPADEMTSMLVARENQGYVFALREHLAATASESVSKGGEREMVTEGAS